MPTYEITIRNLFVEASNEEEAEAIAEEMLSSGICNDERFSDEWWLTVREEQK